MGRKPNPNKKPVPTNVRVRMHRQRKKMKATRQRFLNNYIENNIEPVSIEANADKIETSTLKTELRHWANSHRISKRAVNSLLSILNSNGISSVPKNYRTLLQTPIIVEIRDVAGGKFWYNGLEKSLRLIFSTLNCDISISLNFNFDGLPLYNSSKISFWPILASIFGMIMPLIIHDFESSKYSTRINFQILEMPHIQPIVVAVWCGTSKPTNLNDYLDEFVEELKQLLTNPISVKNHFITVRIRCFICDSPARAFIKGTFHLKLLEYFINFQH